MKANDILKMAEVDAQRWLEATHLSDELANKFERLSGYGEAFDKVFSKIHASTYPQHIEAMNHLRDKLDATQASLSTRQINKLNDIVSKSGSSNWGKVTLVSCAIVGVYVFSQTEKGQGLKNKLFRGLRSAKDNATEATIRYVNDVADPEKKPTVEGETSS